jgi:hypothetical protein
MSPRSLTPEMLALTDNGHVMTRRHAAGSRDALAYGSATEQVVCSCNWSEPTLCAIWQVQDVFYDHLQRVLAGKE